ncbi:hypothetical protein LguiA_032697 [Lonicera macranthoides]
MQLVANIIRLSSLSLGGMINTGSGGLADKSVLHSSPLRVNQSSQKHKSASETPLYLQEREESKSSSSYMVSENIEGRFGDYIKKFHEKINKDGQ